MSYEYTIAGLKTLIDDLNDLDMISGASLVAWAAGMIEARANEIWPVYRVKDGEIVDVMPTPPGYEALEEAIRAEFGPVGDGVTDNTASLQGQVKATSPDATSHVWVSSVEYRNLKAQGDRILELEHALKDANAIVDDQHTTINNQTNELAKAYEALRAERTALDKSYDKNARLQQQLAKVKAVFA